MEMRSRIVSKRQYTNVYQLSLGPPYGGEPATKTWNTFTHQRTESEGHPVSRLSANTGEDIGGNFLTQKTSISSAVKSGFLVYYKQTPEHRHMRGHLLAAEPPQIFLKETPVAKDWEAVAQLPHVSFLHERGATAIADTVPTNPTVSAAASIGELRERLPSLPGRSVLKNGPSPQNLAGEYLNFEFGVKPIVADVRNFVEAYQGAEKHLEQLYRDSGRLVRRKRAFPTIIESASQTSQGFILPYGPGISAYTTDGQATLDTTTTTTRDVWFSGAYTYLFPRQEGFHQKMKELEKIYGIIPDINDVYQLTPWSWAVDWVSNLGSVVQNLNSFSQDGLVLRYGYIMCKTTHEVTKTWRGRLMLDGIPTPTEITTRWSCVSKQRQRATPYGFGLNPDTFTTRQWAILAALGISRGGR